MEYFFRSREKILTLCGVPGVFSSVIRALVETPDSFQKFCRTAGITLLPFLILYMVTYFINRALIRLWAKKDLLCAQREILGRLVDGGVSGVEVAKEAKDLIQEEAWDTLKDYWRAK